MLFYASIVMEICSEMKSKIQIRIALYTAWLFISFIVMLAGLVGMVLFKYNGIASQITIDFRFIRNPDKNGFFYISVIN